MSKTNKGLLLAERICFILGGIIFIVSNFFPLFAYKLSGTVDEASYLSISGGVVYFFSLAIFLIGFLLLVFGEKKHFIISSALSLSSPLAVLGVTVSYLVYFSSLDTAYELGVGGYLLFVSLALFLAAYILHAIDAMLGKELESVDIDRRIEAVKTYKQYLSEGLISEEEYEKKKSEILGLSKKETKK